MLLRYRLVLTIGSLLAQQGAQPLNDVLKEVHDTLSQGPTAQLDKVLEQAVPFVRDSAQYGRDSVADALEDPKTRLGWNVSGSVAAKNWLATPGAEVGGDGGGYVIKKGPVEFHGSFNPEDRSVTMTWEIGGEVLGNGIEIKRVLSCSYAYPDDATYRRAMGLDVTQWQGVRQVLKVMESLVPGKPSSETGTQQQRIQSLDQSAAAALNQLRAVVPDMFEAATQIDSITVGEGWSVGVPAGAGAAAGGAEIGTKLSLNHMRAERIRTGQAKSVSFATTSVGFGISANAGGLTQRLLKGEGTLSASLSRSDDPEQKTDPGQAVTARMIRTGALEGLAAEAIERTASHFSPERRKKTLHLAMGTELLPVRGLADKLEQTAAGAATLARNETEELIQRSRDALGSLQKDAEIVYQASKEHGVEAFTRLKDGTHRLMQVAEDNINIYELGTDGTGKMYRLESKEAAKLSAAQKVGGVKFDVAADILRALSSDNSKVGKRAVLIEGQLVLVSLRNHYRRFLQAGKWQGAGGELTEPGSISRVNGYIYLPTEDDVVLIGIRHADMPSMKFEDLVVAMQSVWKDGGTPTCSLDPLPNTTGGPQYTRVEGVPKHCHFAEVMLEADYTMKLINFGLLPSGAPGFRSKRDLAFDRPDLVPKRSRFWFYPLQPSNEQLQISPSRDAALFAANLEVRTETMMLAEQGLVGAGKPNELNEKIARLFTENMGDITRKHKSIAELRIILDLTVLARLLRQAELESQCLDDISSLAYPERRVRDFYPAATQDMGGGSRLVGGADLMQRLGRRKMASKEDLQFLRLRSQAIELSQSGEVSEASSETSLVITPMTFRLGAIENQMRAGLKHLENANAAEAASTFSAILSKEPGLPEALAMRAICRVELGQLESAQRDIEDALSEDPHDEKFLQIAAYVAHRRSNKVIEDARHRRRLAEAARMRAELKLEEGRNKEATADIEMAISIDPTYAPAYYARALIKQAQNRFWEAIDDWDMVVKCSPGWFAGYTNRGVAKLNVRDLWGTIDDCDTAIGIAPDHFLAYWARGTAKSELSNDEDSIRDFDEAIQRHPQFDLSYQNRASARFKLGDLSGWAADLQTYTLLGNEQDVASYMADSGGMIADGCTRLLGRSPNNYAAHVLRGIVHQQQGDLEAAMADLTAALTCAQPRPGARIPVSALQNAMTQYATGLSRPDRSRARVFYRRGTVLSRLGRQAEAIADLQRAADLDPALKHRTDLPDR